MTGDLKQITNTLSQAANEATEGNISAFEVYIHFKEIEKVLKGLIQEVKEEALPEAIRYKGENHLGYKVEIKQGGRYTYDHLPDVQVKADELKALQKDAQMAYKAACNQKSIYDGEGIAIDPAKYVPNATAITLTKIK